MIEYLCVAKKLGKVFMGVYLYSNVLETQIYTSKLNNLTYFIVQKMGDLGFMLK